MNFTTIYTTKRNETETQIYCLLLLQFFGLDMSICCFSTLICGQKWKVAWGKGTHFHGSVAHFMFI